MEALCNFALQNPSLATVQRMAKTVSDTDAHFLKAMQKRRARRAEQMVRKRCRDIQRAKNAYGPGIFNFDDNAMIEENEEDGNETQSAAILEDFSNETGDHDHEHQ
ncbi:hypothetical protein T12_12213 [Trichinella patagoniensis]|uniref:Uncharacterized protein n=1 Tax=Trichinella patagoniensis TaxID=990121 RepID=A0A0V0ZIB0_9BILA|nr:hypothetical protein T12_12213 [Trichinella patagoniensis]